MRMPAPICVALGGTTPQTPRVPAARASLRPAVAAGTGCAAVGPMPAAGYLTCGICGHTRVITAVAIKVSELSPRRGDAVLAVAAALVSAVGYGSGDFAGGLATRRASVIRVALLTQSVSAAVIGIAVWSSGAPRPTAGAVAWGMLGGLAGACGALALLAGFRHAVFSVAAPLSAVGAAGFSVLAGLLLGERPSPLALTGIVLALPAIVGVSVSARARPGAPPAPGGPMPLGGPLPVRGRCRLARRTRQPTPRHAAAVCPGRGELRAHRRRLLRAAVHRAEPGRLRQRLLAGVLQPD